LASELQGPYADWGTENPPVLVEGKPVLQAISML
jgi:hypothetical protein